MRIRILMSLLVGIGVAANAQKDPNTRFGKISAEDLAPKVYSVDSGAPAVVLFDVGESQIIGNQKGSLSMEFRHRKRLHVLNKNGYEYADVIIPLYRDGNDESELTSLKAATYNLESGKLVTTTLDKKSIYKEVVDKNHLRVKFTFPSVKEGSVIEYDYTVRSDFYFTLMPWEFQGSIPRLWSEYKFSLPQFMDYVVMAQGYFPFHIKEQKDRNAFFSFSDATSTGATQTSNLNCNVTDYRWVMKNVTVLKQEQFTSTLDNHIARINFQLSAYKEPFTPRQIMTSWPTAAKALLEREDFGRLFLGGNNWLDDEVKEAIAGAKDEATKARNIYRWVRDQYTCSDHSSLIPDQNLRSVVKNRKGTVSEINLLLVAMYRIAGFSAAPVVLSTRDNGYASPFYPIMSQLNYVVCKVELASGPVFLDASYSQLGFGKLMYDCYNGQARVIDEAAPPVALMADSLEEKKVSFINVVNVAGKWTGRVEQTPGYYESYTLREKIRKDGIAVYKKELEKNFTTSANISNLTIDSLKRFEDPVRVAYDVELVANGEDLLYLNPLVGEKIQENPFKSAERSYPVEMPFSMNETFIVSIEVPTGYEIDELPKQVRMLMNEEGDARFDYLISQSGNIISMRAQLQVKRTYFQPDEYDMLREFFNHVLAKQAEQIVFKKKK